MNTPNSLFALAIALTVNAAALAGLSSAMTDGAQRAQIAQIEPARLVILAKKPQTEQASAQKGRRS